MPDEVTQPPGDLLFDPPPSAWTGLVRTPGDDATTRNTRFALGLPTDRPVVMGGHQPGVWHAGVLAKWYAIEVFAQHAGAAGAWVVVDQSPGAGGVIEYPAFAGDRSHLVRREIVLGEVGVPPASQKPARVGVPPNAALRGVSDGIALVVQLLEHHAHEPTLARQLHGACVELIGRGTGFQPVRLPTEPRAQASGAVGGADKAGKKPVACAQGSVGGVRSLFATDLHTMPAFAELVSAMRADPVSCTQFYNEAAAGHPEAGVRALEVRGGVVELPLWERSGSPDNPGPWQTVNSDRLPDLADDQIVLRGLPMTGLLRRWVCDLFVHGTGGGASHAEAGYDRVTERWLASWLGAEDLAPAVVASATLRLDFSELPGTRDIPAPVEIARARALAHRAAHDPSLLGAADLGSHKRDLVQQMETLPRRGADRAALYSQMQAIRVEAVRLHAAQFTEIQAHAAALAARAGEAGIVADRGWSFAFHTPEVLAQLHKSIEAAFA